MARNHRYLTTDEPRSLSSTPRPGKSYRWLQEVVETDTDECVPWPFGVDNAWGYGRLTIKGRRYMATHVALELDGRPRPHIEGHHGAVALHSCDNPPCCNPRHLRWGTQLDNVADRVDRHRGRSGAQSDLTPQNVRDIRTLSRQGWSLRRLSDEYGVSPVAIGQIVRHETWKHVRCVAEAPTYDEDGNQRVTGCLRCT